MYKLILIDIDDTLLNDDRQISAGTREALKQAMDKGVVVTLATGRMYASAKQIAGSLQLNVPLITYQGSLVKTLLDENVLYERSVPAESAVKLYEYCKEHGLHLQLYHDDILYVQEDNDKAKAYADLSKIPYTVHPDFEQLVRQSMTKMLVIDEPEVLDRHAIVLKELIGGDVHITKSKPNFLEFVHKEGTKGDALRFLASHCGCQIEETIAFGDSWNDMEMITTAGLGVAMGNAVPALKAAADYVTLSNNDDGVKHVIDAFILGTAEKIAQPAQK
ncbi:Cof-type HAD-IIB family hydrolase [Paenibacillus turpanensis]|uniref:Cof-type HAD-IIB family hydrolase n=1 Tax=Paenibacillus turpanensis TaxID=2689078 RepID=UPI0014098637|nr:Cof-type HAD-IIB family hydrolase [Paenibacillus turpanensis]